MRSALYQCTVFHHRETPVAYGFTLPTFMFHLDLDELDALAEELPLLSHNADNVYNFRDDDHLYLGHLCLRDNVAAYLQAHDIKEPLGRIELMTNLRTCGYVFNPVSFYFCHDPEDRPLAIVVEVHNTFGELKPFLLRPQDQHDRQFKRSFDKHFYISPFAELDNTLHLKVRFPGERLAIHINSSRTGESRPFFRSSLTGQRIPLTHANLVRYSLRFPFITLKVITLIHYHALRLYLKKVPFLRKSEQADLQTGILPKKDMSRYTVS